MEINPNRSIRPVPKSQRQLKVDRTEAKAEEVEETSFVGSDLLSAIKSGLDALPEIRQDRVELGKKLVDDPDYPSEKDLDDLSKLTLKNLPSDKEIEEES